MVLNRIFDSWVRMVMPIRFSWLQAAALAASAAGNLAQGAGALMGGDEQKTYYPQQTFDYTNYAMAMQRETRNKILNMINKRSYEGYEGGKNLATIASSTAQQFTRTPPTNYADVATQQYAAGKEGLKPPITSGADTAVSDVLGEDAYKPSAPYAEIYKSDEEKTEWDLIAENNGILVTKYSDFQTKDALRKELYAKNLSESEVSGMEIAIGYKIAGRILDTVFPGANKILGDYCKVGQCDDMMAGVIRGIKAMGKTASQLGGHLFKEKMEELGYVPPDKSERKPMFEKKSKVPNPKEKRKPLKT